MINKLKSLLHEIEKDRELIKNAERRISEVDHQIGGLISAMQGDTSHSCNHFVLIDGKLHAFSSWNGGWTYDGIQSFTV